MGSSVTGLIHNGTKIEDSKKKMANIFNNVFANTAHKINEKMPEAENHP